VAAFRYPGHRVISIKQIIRNLALVFIRSTLHQKCINLKLPATKIWTIPETSISIPEVYSLSSGVTIPASNISGLMLRKDVVKAVRRGKDGPQEKSGNNTKS